MRVEHGLREIEKTVIYFKEKFRNVQSIALLSLFLSILERRISF